jgi:hypothetical protein
MPVAASAQASSLATNTETLRAAFILNPETAWTPMTASERMAPQRAFGPCQKGTIRGSFGPESVRFAHIWDHFEHGLDRF